MADKPAAAWPEVWNLALNHEAVFRTVFRDLSRKGLVLGSDGERDLVHEFLVDRAANALATFHPERGALPGWLYVVFRRFVLGSLRTIERDRRLLESLAREASPRPSDDRAHILDAVDAAVDQLPKDERRALQAYFGDREHGERAVARALGVSRWKAGRLVARAAKTVVSAIGRQSTTSLPLNAASLAELIPVLRKHREEIES